MKKYLKISFAIIFLFLLGFLGYQFANQLKHKNAIAENIREIPAFSFETMDGKMFTKAHLDSQKATVFIFFNSECDYCQHEAQDIQNHVEDFHETQFIFVSVEDKDRIRKFSETYQLSHYDFIHFARDPSGSFITTFDANSIPFLLIYNREGKLVEKIKGQTKAENILKKLALSQD
ncbi:MAG: redoxin [Bacteroidetes bacterium HGW-Bacteroidetes-13]|nr:MAG: redoxin [Bacteroidetes bacterium HGW-Bacteroidetes-13]